MKWNALNSVICLYLPLTRCGSTEWKRKIVKERKGAVIKMIKQAEIKWNASLVVQCDASSHMTDAKRSPWKEKSGVEETVLVAYIPFLKTQMKFGVHRCMYGMIVTAKIWCGWEGWSEMRPSFQSKPVSLPVLIFWVPL